MQVLCDVSRNFKAHLDSSQGHLQVEWPNGQTVLTLGTWSVVQDQGGPPDDVWAWLQDNAAYLRRWASILQVGLQLGQAA